jgi:hypothetical protein
VTVLCDWSLSAALPLGQGNHTIEVRALGVPVSGNATATVSGGSTSVNQGALTVMVLKK